MTSRYPGEFGFRHHRDPVALPDDATTMAEILADAGYSTRAIVSHIYAGSLVGLDQGFDSIDETHARGHDYVSSPHLVQAAAGILSSTDADPLFLYVHWFDPHYTYIGHREFTYPSDYDGAITDVLTQDSLLAVVDQLTDDDLQQVRRIYDSEIALTDQYIGALIDHLKSSGRYDDALVIVVADHGEEFNDHGRGWIGHSTSVEPAQIHVPLVIKYPGNVHAGESYDEWVGLVDVLPTVLEQAGVRPADLKSFRGASLLPAGRHAAPVFAEVYTESEHFQAAITGGFQMILDRRRNARSYRDLARDPTGRTEGLRDGSGTYNLLLQQLKNFDSQIEDAAPAGRRRSVNLSPAEALKLKSLGYLQ